MAISAEILKSYPAIDEAAVEALLQKEIAANHQKIVVLDDDPTGVQTVHDSSVYTTWDRDSIRQGFEEENNLFYIMTNSRGFTAEETEAAHKEIANVVDAVAKETGKGYLFISRSDSTLRGHYPLETVILKEAYEAHTGKTIDGEILCPFFKEGGRFTIDDIHYVKYGEELVPAAETEFAKDKTFGYTQYDIKDYVEEKTKGAYKAADVTSIALGDIRAMDYDKIEAQLMSVTDFNKIIVNAVDYVDVKVFCVALYRAMAKGNTFMFRTATAIVKVMGGVTDQPLLTREEMVVKETDNGGIIVVGSQTEKTSQQVDALKENPNIVFVELDATLVADEAAFSEEVNRCLELEEAAIRAGKTVCVYTTRKLITADTGDKEDDLRLSVQISDAVQSLVGRLNVVPSFVIAKGGITSSDVGTKALAVKKANVIGQIKPGIPVWQTGAESKFPLTPYVIFPGNVGEITTLREAAEVLMMKA
ncbi:four-carbon acid sugar kinase family protein [Eubacterium aggregans]|uniref:four-carbon acid sugar kinase family protein n=1 Tax=Eubacterium aggregans TaxID=81409 RepID=UPI003F3E98DA